MSDSKLRHVGNVETLVQLSDMGGKIGKSERAVLAQDTFVAGVCNVAVLVSVVIHQLISVVDHCVAQETRLVLLAPVVVQQSF